MKRVSICDTINPDYRNPKRLAQLGVGSLAKGSRSGAGQRQGCGHHNPTKVDQAGLLAYSAQRRAADFVLQNLLETATMMIEGFAERSGAFTATVTRFVCFLGYTGYSEFRAALPEALRLAMAPVDSFADSYSTKSSAFATFVTARKDQAAREDGGFGGPTVNLSPSPPAPDSLPDAVVTLATRRDQALLFRLLGDRNPLHAHPQTALGAGFIAPILHGLCTFGKTFRAVLRAFASYNPTRELSHQARLSLPCTLGTC